MLKQGCATRHVLFYILSKMLHAVGMCLGDNIIEITKMKWIGSSSPTKNNRYRCILNIN